MSVIGNINLLCRASWQFRKEKKRGVKLTGVRKWLYEMPPASLYRLQRINHAATSSAHIILALSYGVHDKHIRALNKMIVGLLLGRHKAHRKGDTAAEERIERKLQDLHEVINGITGVHVNNADAGNVCKSVRRMTARSTFSH